MNSYKELLTEKTKVRLTDPARHEALNMILDGASKLAKKEQVEVTEKHLLASVRSLVSNTESTMELLKDKGVPTFRYAVQLAEYLEFLGPQKSEEEVKALMEQYISYIPEEDRIRKNTKTFIAALSLTPELGEVDSKVINRLLAGMLK